MKTRIPVLDAILGNNDKNIADLPTSQTMLIRGAPGSGKTTLALEILARAITEDESTFGIFISLEVPPLTAWGAVKQRLSPDLQTRLPIQKVKPVPEDYDILHNKNSILLFAGQKWCQVALACSDSMETIEDRLAKELKDFIERIMAARKEFQNQKPLTRGLIVIDSVNLLGEHLHNISLQLGQTQSIRSTMFRVWSILERQRTDLAQKTPCDLILIGEHYPGKISDVSQFAESFSCDIELLLAAEPIAGIPNMPVSLLGPLGYAYERNLASKVVTNESQEPQFIEIRSFCRVLKSRFTKNQSRRCSFDIVPGQGANFEERFPGDGSLLLFFENERQKIWWDLFLTHDAPRQFPALRYSLFNRPGMQRTFATQRAFGRLNQKTDMALACFDTYWVNWYWQLGQRCHLLKLLKASFPRAEQPTQLDLSGKDPLKVARDRWQRFLCAVDRFAAETIKNQPKYSLNAAGLKQFRPEFRRTIKSNEHMREWLKAMRLHERVSRTIFTPPIIGRPNESDEKTKNIHVPAIALFRCIVNAAIQLADGTVGLIQPMDKSDLRLFGERRSEFIRELPMNLHPLYSSDDAKVISVPYNANVSFLVRDERLFETALKFKNENAPAWKEGLSHLLSIQQTALGVFDKKAETHLWDKIYVDKCTINPLVFPEVELKKAVADMKVQTWEELILLCTQGHLIEDQSEEAPNAPQYQLGIETHTYDTILCFFLEVFWGFGGQLHINHEYQITNTEDTCRKLFQSFFLLREMYRQGIISRESSLEPARLINKQAENIGRNWLFARQWHSTFVDILTAKRPDDGEWAYRHGEDMKFDIQPLPFSGFSEKQGIKVSPVSCWGEWHFAVLSGTENKTLAVTLINNLMSSTAICERSYRGAAVPTVEEFYVRYSNIPFIRLSDRIDIAPFTFTFQHLRDNIFKYARSRNTIFDFRHCMRELHSVFSLIQQNPTVPTDKLADKVIEAIIRISSLNIHGAMMH